MKLELRNGKVVRLKADGSPSKAPVSMKNTIVFCGFPETRGDSIKVLAGDPMKSEILLVKASGSSWWGTLLLSKTTGECVEIQKADIDYAEELVNEPPKGGYSLEKIITQRKKNRERKLQMKRDSVNIKILAQEKGLTVWESLYFHGYWCQKYGEFNELPDGWDILPKGDAALTKRVHKGPHWILMKKQAEYSELIGTASPVENIERAFIELGGDEGAIRRQKGKQKGQQRREEIITSKLKTAIRRCFPNIPKSDLDNVISTSRSKRAVGTAQWLYFKTAESDEPFDLAASLAVRAYVRHEYTNYDEILSESYPGSFGDDEIKYFVRAEVAGEIEKVLAKWI